jgi:KRAB domain-containing zinc finger protein
MCRKHFPSEMELKQHLRSCIKTGWKLKVLVQRLSEEEILALSKPHSDGSQSHENHGENLKSTELLQQHADSHSTPIPGKIKCSFKSCTLVFSSLEDFKEHNEMHFQAMQFSCDVCGKLFTRKSKCRLHMQRHTKLRPYACDVPGCSYLGKVPFDLYKHKKRVHSSILYTCLLCGKNIKTHQNYKLHMAKHNKDMPGVSASIHQSCKQPFKNVEYLRKHPTVAQTNLKQLQCNQCSKCFASKSILANHIIMHWDWRPFKCDSPRCSFAAKRLQDLQSHKNKVHTLNRFTCSHCGKMIKDRVWFKYHEEKHKTNTPGVLKCLHFGCRETFSVTKDLRTHTKQHQTDCECDVPGCLSTSQVNHDLHVHRRKMHTCQLCGKGFHNSSRLKQHMHSHETEEPGVIKCAITNCKQTFTSRADLKKHLDNHEALILHQNESKINANEFECQLCGKIIKGRRSALHKHVVKHETGTPGVIKCIFRGCKQTFTSDTDLKVHAAKHWDDSLRPLRPFTCDFPQCNYASRMNNNLVNHKRIMHSSNLYTCHLCGKQFKNLLNVYQHITNCDKKQLSADNPNLTAERPKTVEEQQEMVFKDEIEEVVFD